MRGRPCRPPELRTCAEKFRAGLFYGAKVARDHGAILEWGAVFAPMAGGHKRSFPQCGLAAAEATTIAAINIAGGDATALQKSWSSDSR